MDQLFHTIVNIDDKCLDLLLTQEEIATAFARAVDPANGKNIDLSKCCKCWPLNSAVECCPFWKKIFGTCENCEEKNPYDTDCVDG